MHCCIRTMEQVRRINFNSPIKADDLNLADYGGGINADGDDYCSITVSKIAESMAGYEHAKDKVHAKRQSLTKRCRRCSQ